MSNVLTGLLNNLVHSHWPPVEALVWQHHPLLTTGFRMRRLQGKDKQTVFVTTGTRGESSSARMSQTIVFYTQVKGFSSKMLLSWVALARQVQLLKHCFSWDVLHGNAIFHINKIFFLPSYVQIHNLYYQERRISIQIRRSTLNCFQVSK